VRFGDQQITDSSRGSSVVVVVQPFGKDLHAAFEIVAVFHFVLGECEGAEIGELVAEVKFKNLAFCSADVFGKLLVVACITFAGKLSASFGKLIAGLADSSAYCQLGNLIVIAVQEAFVELIEIMFGNAKVGHGETPFPDG
jgi:hypothetical protein